MRRITAGLFTADGVIGEPGKWNPPYVDDEPARSVLPRLAGADTHTTRR